MADYLRTYSKVKFTPLEPKEEQILIEDIAHALSLMSRANGHFSEFYSVAQHCIFCAKEALSRGYGEKIALACLLHDGSEAYITDIARPVKKNLLRYLEIEEVLQNAIYEKYLGKKLTAKEEELVKKVDDSMLYYEFIHYMDEALDLEKEELKSKPIFKLEEFKTVEDKYIDLFDKLMSNVEKVVS